MILLGHMLKWDQVECNQQVYFIMINPNVLTQIQHWKCEKRLQIPSGPSSFSLTNNSSFLCRLSHVNFCENELECLPVGLLHLGQLKLISAAKNKLTSLFNIPNGTHTNTLPIGVSHADTYRSLHKQNRQHYLGWHQPLSGTLFIYRSSTAVSAVRFRVTDQCSMHWVCISN